MRRRFGHRSLVRTLIVFVTAACILAAGAVVYAKTSDDAQTARKRTAKAFTVKARLATQLRPGIKSQVWLRFGNRRKSTIWIRSLRFKLSIDAAHTARGCSVTRDFVSYQLPRKAFPIKVTKRKKIKRGKKRKTRWLTPRMLRVNGRPAIMMKNLDNVNQDACKNAHLSLTFTGKATNRKPRKSKSSVRSANTATTAVEWDE